MTDPAAPVDPTQGPAAGKPKSRKHTRAIWTTIAFLAVFFIGVGIGSSGKSTTTANVAAPAPLPAATVTVAAAPSPAVTVTAAPPAPPAPAGPSTAITEGTWTVGTDVAAGAYKTTAAVTPGCYWAISTSGSNGVSGILSNGLPTGGFPTVTLKVGQDFTTQGCGDWAKKA